MTDTLRIDAQDLERVRRFRFEVVMVLPGADSTLWGGTLRRAVEETLADAGARLVAIIDAGDEAAFATQALARASFLEPSAIISRPVGGATSADAHRALARAGVRLVLLDDTPAGLLADRDFATVVQFDEGAVGAAVAQQAAGLTSREGGIGILGPATDPLAGSERERALRAWIREHRPDLRISAMRYGDSASPGAAALRLLVEDPGIEAIVVAEDIAAMEVVRRLTGGGLCPAVVTVDLGAEAATELAAGGLVRGVVARQPWDQGEAAATAALLALIDRPVPPLTVVPSLTVTRESVLEAWVETWHEHPPVALTSARWDRPRA